MKVEEKIEKDQAELQRVSACKLTKEIRNVIKTYNEGKKLLQDGLF